MTDYHWHNIKKNPQDIPQGGKQVMYLFKSRQQMASEIENFGKIVSLMRSIVLCDEPNFLKTDDLIVYFS